MSVTLTYNGISLTLAKHTLTSDVVYSDDGIDLLYSHYKLTAQGVVNQDYTYKSNTAYLKDIRYKLAQPRKALTFSIDGEPLIATTGADINNGPKPLQPCTVVQFTGKTIIVQIEIETWLNECDTSPSATMPAVLSNRWTQSQDLSDDGYSTLTTEGILVCKAGENPDNHRDKIYPLKNIPAGFKRVGQKATISSDGQKLKWSCRDQEQYVPAVKPVVKWSGEWTEESSMTSGSGALVVGTLAVSLWGEKTTDKTAILDFLGKVITTRINLTKDIIRSYRITEGLSENKITASITVLCTSGSDTSGVIKLLSRIGQPLKAFTEGQPTEWKTRGNYNATLTANIVKDSTCEDKTNSSVPPYVSPGNATNGTASASTGSGTSTSSLTTNKLSSEHLASPYVSYKIESRITGSTHTLGPTPPADSSATRSVFVQTAIPTSIKEVKFVVERMGKVPKLPSTYINTDHVLLDFQVSTSEPEFLPDGNHKIYRVEGLYKFGLVTAFDLGKDTFTLPKSPIDGSSEDEHISGGDFGPGIVK